MDSNRIEPLVNMTSNKLDGQDNEFNMQKVNSSPVLSSPKIPVPLPKSTSPTPKRPLPPIKKGGLKKFPFRPKEPSRSISIGGGKKFRDIPRSPSVAEFSYKENLPKLPPQQLLQPLPLQLEEEKKKQSETPLGHLEDNTPYESELDQSLTIYADPDERCDITLIPREELSSVDLKDRMSMKFSAFSSVDLEVPSNSSITIDVTKSQTNLDTNIEPFESIGSVTENINDDFNRVNEHQEDSFSEAEENVSESIDELEDEEQPIQNTKKVASKWDMSNKVLSIEPDDIDWEDEMKLELEGKWEMLEKSNGPIMFSTIRQTIKKHWTKKLTKHSIHNDLPGFISKLEIVDETTGTLLFKENPLLDTYANIREMIRTLVMETQSEEKSNEVIANFNSFKGTGNSQLENFIKKGCKNYEDNDAPWIKILKCLHKKIVLPATIYMKKIFTEKYSFNNVKDTWSIRISFFKGGIEIKHSREERGTGVGNISFQFDWNLQIKIDPDFHDMFANMAIVNYRLDDKSNKAALSTLKNVMQPFLHGSAQYTQIFKKPLKQLNVHRDFYRMCHRLSIFKSNGKTIYTRKENESPDVILKEILISLCKYLSPKILPSLEHALERYIKPTGDMSEQLAKILNDEAVIPEDSRLASVLKCVNANIVYPAIDMMHQGLYDRLKFKDVRGTWNVHITFGPSIRGRSTNTNTTDKTVVNDLFIEPLTLIETSTNEKIQIPEDSDGNVQYRYVNILHRKCEQSYSCDPKEFFSFEWVLSITLDRKLASINDVVFGIVDFNFSPHTSEEMKQHVIQNLKPYLRPSTLTEASVSIDSSTLLDAAIKKIEMLEKQQHLLNAYHHSMPHSLPLSVLLRSLKDSIPFSPEVKIVKD